MCTEGTFNVFCRPSGLEFYRLRHLFPSRQPSWRSLRQVLWIPFAPYMGYLFFYIERFLWILWILCEIYSLLAMIIFFTQRAQRFITFPISRLRWSGRKLRYDKSAQRVLSTPSPLRGTPACLRGRKRVMALVSCNYSHPLREGWAGIRSPSLIGRDGVGPEGPWGGLFSKKLYTPLCTLQGGEILVSPRLGPRMKSVWNMNSQAHDNMSALPRQNDGDNGCSKCTATSPILLL